MKNIKVLADDGKIKTESYKKIVEHEAEIIKDNVFHAAKCGTPEIEIRAYEKEAYAELEELKKRMLESNDIVLKLDLVTERYVVARKE